MLISVTLMAASLGTAQAQPVDDASDSGANPATQHTNASSEPVQSAKADATEDDGKIICRRTAITGSKFKKKLCGTKSEWDALQRRGSETTRRWQQRGKGVEPGGDPGI